MKKLDVLKNILDNEVHEYLERESPDTTDIDVETSIDFEDDVEYEATVHIEAKYKYVSDYITDDYGNRHNESYHELVNYKFDIIDLIDIENDCYLIEDGKEV